MSSLVVDVYRFLSHHRFMFEAPRLTPRRHVYQWRVDVANRFHSLKYGLAVVLMFVGTKMLIVDGFKFPVMASLGTVAAIILASVIASLLIAPKPLSVLERRQAIGITASATISASPG